MQKDWFVMLFGIAVACPRLREASVRFAMQVWRPVRWGELAACSCIVTTSVRAQQEALDTNLPVDAKHAAPGISI